MWERDFNYDPVHDDPDYQAMDEKQLEGQSRLLIELGEPESWLETMLRAARRSATHADDIGDSSLAGRWRNLTRALEYASAAAAHDPMTAGEPTDTATQSQSTPEPDRPARANPFHSQAIPIPEAIPILPQ